MPVRCPRRHKELKRGSPCRTCQRKFVSEAALDGAPPHVTRRRAPGHDSVPSLRREKCSTVLRLQEDLDQHHIDNHLPFERQHKESQHWHQWQVCYKEFVHETALDQHTKAERSLRHYRDASRCDAVVRSQEALDHHPSHRNKHPLFERQHKESQHWYCQACDREFVHEAALDQHTEAEHSQRYYCDTCGTRLHSQQALDQHHTDKHPLFECLYCKHKFTTNQALDQHGRDKHSPRYPCDTCGTVLRSQQALDQHHTEKHPLFECLYCERKLTTGQGRPAHKEATHPAQFKCEHCGRKFSTDDARWNHEHAEHHRVFEWQYGDLEFASDDARLQRENAKDRFTCRYCDTAFILLESRQYHEQMKHTLAFQCSRCRLKFHTIHARDAHEKTDHSYSTVVGSFNAAQPQPVSSYLASLFFSPQPIRSEPSHISDTEGSQLASPATSQCSHAEVDESSHDPAESQTSDEETSSLDQKDISHPSDDTLHLLDLPATACISLFVVGL
ncbi:hypothetical protein PAXINDRAFT_12673 [Paxillus involutus ATCC 200175]|uniref:C2H2-type domain-containing protein n=1 Tax=Paxillus involutus ATCC 200175 TaxID=664439 RepID=A0A0C9U5Y3_PAXIN|nr:hypothetical protein PAXINDRAFT_12673 [Paxillus involutus ATCC 200175]